jgi:hypothetical protein
MKIGVGNSFMTSEGGFATRVINKTGAASVKGTIVEADKSVDNAVALAGIDDPDPCGIVYENGVPDGGFMYVVTTGIADVKYGTAVTRGTFARIPVTADSVAAGLAVAEALPTSPFATDKHFREIGHPLETIASPGLAKTILHFN